MKIPNHRAALYLRSSKDRSDVSIDAQRRELQRLAADRHLLIVKEYADVVESAKDEHRAGFQALLHDLKSPQRPWGVLLMVDTSRLSRRRYVAQVFKHEARKRGVEILYSKVPEVDPITGVLLEAVLEAFDEVHSLMSKQKGLAGMAENVRQGYRAGGRAPLGYQLKRVSTGAVREGEEVTKSVLEPSGKADLALRYLKGRAAGKSRRLLKQELGLVFPESTLIGIEWNALTYAGHTVWNVHSEFEKGEGYTGGHKRRPRAEWVIQRNTHASLITDEEAEAILSRLEASKHSKTRRTPATYLLTGLLKTPGGEAWYGNGLAQYRTKVREKRGRYVPMDDVEIAVIGKMLEDMQSPTFIRQLVTEARKFAATHAEDSAAPTRKAVTEINQQISKTMGFAAGLQNPAPALRKIDELESQRQHLVEELARLEQETAASMALAEVTEPQVKHMLAGVVEEMQAMRREALKDFLACLTERIVLDPVSLDCQIHYRIGIEGRNKLASPRGCEPRLPP
jgi:DNA invertase Pin-like site-specific DNA recombinase